MFSAILPWFFNLELLGLLTFPLVFSTCTKLYDRGYALSKALGLILTCYIAWLLANVGNPASTLARFVRPVIGSAAEFNYYGVALAAAIVAVFSFISAARNANALISFIQGNWKLICGIELLYLVAFGAMLLLRAQVPEIMYHTFDPA